MTGDQLSARSRSSGSSKASQTSWKSLQATTSPSRLICGARPRTGRATARRRRRGVAPAAGVGGRCRSVSDARGRERGPACRRRRAHLRRQPAVGRPDTSPSASPMSGTPIWISSLLTRLAAASILIGALSPWPRPPHTSDPACRCALMSGRAGVHSGSGLSPFAGRTRNTAYWWDPSRCVSVITRWQAREADAAWRDAYSREALARIPCLAQRQPQADREAGQWTLVPVPPAPPCEDRTDKMSCCRGCERRYATRYLLRLQREAGRTRKRASEAARLPGP